MPNNSEAGHMVGFFLLLCKYLLQTFSSGRRFYAGFFVKKFRKCFEIKNKPVTLSKQL